MMNEKISYKRSLEELSKKAILHWPNEILLLSESDSSLVKLIETQDIFISILKVASKTPISWLSSLENNADISGSLFLKHLMVVSDLGGEALNKLPPLSKYIQDGKMSFLWGGVKFDYEFSDISDKCNLTNSSLGVDSKKILKNLPLSNKAKDVCMLILFGSMIEGDTLPQEVKEKCVIGELLGKPKEIEDFIRQRYIYVSKQVSGATANSLGQNTQKYVKDKLEYFLGDGWDVNMNGSLPGVFHSDEDKKTNFDIVVKSPKNNYFGVEISFQVTTNSTIERKSRESESLMKAVHSKGHKICYVIDGAGNINVRKSAVGNLCKNSDCTVAMSESEIEHLANYFKSV